MSDCSVPSSARRTQRSGVRSKTPSSARLEKKRMTDRESQRAVRERTRNYILHLESQVESLKKESEDDRLANLVEQCDQLREQNERLMAVIASIGKLTKSADPSNKAGDNPIDLAASPPGATSLMVTESTADRQPALNAISITERVTPFVPHNNLTLWAQSSLYFEGQERLEPKSPINPTSSLLNERNTTSTSTAQPLTQVTMNAHTAILAEVPACENTEVTIFESVNNLLTAAELLTTIFSKPAEDVDIAIRAVIEGWEVTSQTLTWDRGWEVLRQIDENVFSSCGPVERLALLLIMRLKIRHAIYPDTEHLNLLPQFMRPRTVQNFIQHPSLYDYLPWPDLRDLFILSTSPEKRKNSNQFAPVFTANIRFQWPHDLIDVWARDSCTGLFFLSDAFDKRFNDLQFWTLHFDFFNIRPDLIGYIPIYNPSPGTFFGHFISQEDQGEICIQKNQGIPNNALVIDW